MFWFVLYTIYKFKDYQKPKMDKKALAVGAAVIAGGVAVYYLHQRRKAGRKPKTKAAVVESITIYPIKSCAGVEVRQATLTKNGGLMDYMSGVYDRGFVLMNEEHRYVSARHAPVLFDVQVSITDAGLVVKAPGKEEKLRIPLTFSSQTHRKVQLRILTRTVEGVDCGDEPAAWFEQVTGVSGIRLVHNPHDMIIYEPRVDKTTEKYNLHFNDEKVVFQNLAPCNIMSRESITDVIPRIPRPISEFQFRPNIMVVGCSKPYDEDEWRDISIGSAELRYVRRCARCLQTTLFKPEGSDTYSNDDDPLATLKTYRHDPSINKQVLSIDCGVNIDGIICTGDDVLVTRD